MTCSILRIIELFKTTVGYKLLLVNVHVHVGKLVVNAKQRSSDLTIKHWEMKGDQLQDWHTAAVDIDMNDVEQVWMGDVK